MSLPSHPNPLTQLPFTHKLSAVCEKSHSHNISPSYLAPGVEARLDNINQLKVKGLVLGPLHNVQKDQPATLNLQQISPSQGPEEALVSMMEKAHKKGRSSTEIRYWT